MEGSMHAGNVLEIARINGFPVILLRGGVDGVGIGKIEVDKNLDGCEVRLIVIAAAAQHGLVAPNIDGRPNVFKLLPA